jgi:predicted transposase YbfD/YdcC
MQPIEKEIISFYKVLENDLSDLRSVIGTKHYLPFVVLSYILGLITLRTNRSSIHRFMKNRFSWLCELTGHQAHRCVSYAQLGRLLRQLDCCELSAISFQYFGTKIDQISATDWLAADGKDLKGSFDAAQHASRGDVLVRLISHESGQEVARIFYEGNKESEINTVRNLLSNNKLDGHNTTLDALHCNPDTTQQIAAKGGHYMVRVKEDHQKELVKDLTSKERRLPALAHFEDIDKGHGRLGSRIYDCYHISNECFDKRWVNSHLTTCIVVQRSVIELKTGKTCFEKAFYISNAWLSQAPKADKTIEDKRVFPIKYFDARNLCNAIRGHWTIEADHYRRDVSFGEDKCKTPKSKTTKACAILRSIAIEWLKLQKPKNFKELAETCKDCPDVFAKMLRESNFVTLQ